jgi:hypothetical protein
MDMQPTKAIMGGTAEPAATRERTIWIGDVVICTPVEGEDLPGSGKVIAIRYSDVPEHDEYVVQVGQNLLGVYLIRQLACLSTESDPLDSVHSTRRSQPPVVSMDV